MSEKLVLDRIKATIRTHLPNGGQAFLFGSRARGDYRKDSDWDVLIILDKDRLSNDDYLHVSYPLSLLGTDIDEEINPIMYTRKQWEANSFTPFYHNVKAEGIAL